MKLKALVLFIAVATIQLISANAAVALPSFSGVMKSTVDAWLPDGDHNVQTAQYRYRPRTNYNYQRQMQQQRLQQQRMQQQRQRQMMEQRRRQQAVQRQRMMEQRRKQQLMMRQRQQQLQAQRQKAAEQRRIQQNRQRQMQQQRTGQAQKAAQAKAAQVARTKALQRQRLLQLKKARERARQTELKKANQRASDASLAATLRSTRTLSAAKTPAFKKQVASVRDNLKKLKANQVKLKKTNADKLTQKTQKVAKIAQQKARIECVGAQCNCSFDGDTLVKTKRGMVPIRAIEVGTDLVWSRDAKNGVMDWKRVTNHYSNIYQERVEIRYQSETGGPVQTIISNRIHPIFVQLPANDNVPSSSEGHDYRGLISNGRWVDADDLKPGYRLLNSEGGWADVISIGTSANQLTAYNLTVDDFHTYFVGGSDEGSAFWVHNDCSPNQLNKAIRKGWTPRGITRVDVGKVKGEQTHVHLGKKHALNRDGTWKHGGSIRLSNDQKKWLRENGWKLPKE